MSSFLIAKDVDNADSHADKAEDLSDFTSRALFFRPAQHLRQRQQQRLHLTTHPFSHEFSVRDSFLLDSGDRSISQHLKDPGLASRARFARVSDFYALFHPRVHTNRHQRPPSKGIRSPRQSLPAKSPPSTTATFTFTRRLERHWQLKTSNSSTTSSTTIDRNWTLDVNTQATQATNSGI